ncbi:hypothetical protein AWJ20_3008 [Sugiyamaella lignohabitans]|uniref:Sister chromatid cohesion protein n=1 Tax=Sugiyamaella lignohabitans TaxID=796027 RepID=A0A167FJI3_9ASCO|nr:uncharacterized protein AWJ20_3008 [Sugiyamaella lignohabitans]ANB15381.1 hypothetical protein AWJ20_3008 [Sugiyamaella lignohabitans]
MTAPSKEERVEGYQKYFVSVTSVVAHGLLDDNHEAVKRGFMEYSLYRRGYGPTYHTLTLKTIANLERCIKNISAEWIEDHINENSMKTLYEVLVQGLVHVSSNIVLVEEMGSIDNKTSILSEQDPLVIGTNMLSAIEKGLKCSKLLINIYSKRLKNPKYSPEGPLSDIATFLEDLSINLMLRLSQEKILDKSTLSQKEYDMIVNNQVLLEGTHKDLREIFHSIDSYLRHSVLPEKSVIKIEDIAAKFYFVDPVTKTKSISGGAVFRESSIEAMRKICMELILTIFTSYPKERTNILTKLLRSYAHLPDTKIKSKPYQLDGGLGTIESPSAMFMRMVHISGMTIPHDSSDDLTESTDDPLGKHGHTASASSNAINISQSVGGYIISFLIKKVLPDKGEPKASKEEPYKELFQLLTTDFLTVLGHSNWPAAEIMVTIILVTLLPYTTSEVAYSANFAFEVLGMIAPYLYKVKIISENLRHLESQEVKISILPPINVNVSQVKGILDDMEIVLAPQVSSTHSNSYSYLSSLFLFEILSLCKADNVAEEIKELCLRFVDNCESNGAYGQITLVPMHNSSHGDVTTSYSRLLTLRPIALYYDIIVRNVIDTICISKKTTIRTKAFSVLKGLRREDSELLSNQSLMDSVQRLLGPSESTSIRDGALEVFGDQVLLQPEDAGEKYKTICHLCNDPTAGISLKKRAIDYCSRLLTLTQDQEIKVGIICCFCLGLKDDDQSIIDTMMSTLTRHLFPRDLESPKDHLQVNFLLEFNSSDNGRDRTEFLELAISKILGPGSQRTPELNKSAQKLVDTLFEREHQNYSQALGDGNKQYSSSFLKLIGIFAKADGTLVSADQLSSLLSLLQDSSLDVSVDTVSETMAILRYGLNTKKVMDRSFLSKFQEYLKIQLTSHKRPSDMIHIAVCLSISSNLMGNTDRIWLFLANSFQNLKKFERNIQLFAKSEKNMQQYRLIARIVSNLTRYCPLDKSYVEKASPSKGQYSTMSELVVGHYLIPFVKPAVDISIRKVALRAIGTILIGEPGIFTKIRDVKLLYDRVMLSNSKYEIDHEDFFEKNSAEVRYLDEKLLVLKTIDELLRLEEEAANLKLIERARDNNKSSSKDKAVIDLDSLQGRAQNTFRDAATSSIIQAYLDCILKASLSTDPEYSQWAAETLSASIRQNFADPNRSAKVIVALEASSSRQVVHGAKLAHERIHEKFQSRVEQIYAEGIKLAARCHRNVPGRFLGRFNNNGTVGPFRIIWSILKEKKGRRGFLDSLMRKIVINWEKDGDPVRDLAFLKENLNYATFVCYGLADLVFAEGEEVLRIIVEVNHILSTMGADFAVAITALYDSGQGDKVSDERWNCLGEAACLFLLLVRFREFLKIAYDIPESKVKDYTEKKGSRDFKIELREDFELDIDALVASRVEVMSRKENLLLIWQLLIEVEGDSTSADIIEWIQGKLDDDVKIKMKAVISPSTSPVKKRGASQSPSKRRKPVSFSDHVVDCEESSSPKKKIRF